MIEKRKFKVFLCHSSDDKPAVRELSKRLDYTADTRRAMRGDTNQLRRRTESARLENSAALQNILDRATQDHDRITALEDQVTKLLAAVREAGLNRALIRDRLMSHRSYNGVAGAMRFDENSNNVSPPLLAYVERGRFVFR